jgi:hypothetical protein
MFYKTELKMNPEQLTQKIEDLEKQLPHWEKWLFVCYGAAFTFLATVIVKAVEPVERAYLMNALVWIIVQLATLFPGVLLSVHSEWRKVSINKRLNLIFGFFLTSWVVFLSLGAQDLNNVADGYNVLLVGSAIAIGVGYWRLRRKQAGAEEVFP